MCAEPFETAREHCWQRMSKRYSKRKTKSIADGGKATLKSRWANTGGWAIFPTFSQAWLQKEMLLKGLCFLVNDDAIKYLERYPFTAEVPYSG